MAALDPGPAGLRRGVQQLGLVAVAQPLQVRGHLLRAQFADQFAGCVQQALFGAVENQLFRFQVDGGAHGHVFTGQVEDFPGRRVAQRREQDDAALVEKAANTLAVDATDLAGMVIVDTLDHADRPRGDQVAASDPQARALHRRGGHVHRQPRLDGDAQTTHGVDDAFQGRRIGHSQVAVIARSQAARGQARLDLRARTVHQHQARAEAVEKDQVVDDIAESGMLHPFAGEHDHEGAVPVRVDVGRSVT